MNVDKYYTIEKILKIVDYLYNQGEMRVNKSITEFNPADNHFHNGYVCACRDLRQNIKNLLNEGVL